MIQHKPSALEELSPSQAAKLFHLEGEDIEALKQASAVILACMDTVIGRLCSQLSMLPSGPVLVRAAERWPRRRQGMRRWLALGLKPWSPLTRQPRLRHLIIFCSRKNLPTTYIAAICWCLESICVDVLVNHAQQVSMDARSLDKLICAFRKRLAAEQLGLLSIYWQHARRRARSQAARLNRIIRARSARLRSTVTLSQAISDEHEELQVAGVLAQQVMTTFRPDYLTVNLIDHAGVVDTPVAIVNGRIVRQRDDAAMTALRTDWRLCRAARTGRVFHVADVANSLVRCTRQAHEQDCGSYCCVPLTSGTQVVGWMHLRRNRPEAFTEEELEVLSIYGQMVGTAMTSIRLLRENFHQATTDPLTGLYNRRHFQTVLAREDQLLKRRGGGCALLMVDIDHFKDFNDAHGHDTGDRILTSLATTLRNCVRATDEVARLGGDEFVILLRDCDTEGAEQVAAKIVQAAGEARIRLGSANTNHAQLSVSVGLAACPEHAEYLEDAMILADVALMRAKESGRNKHVLFDKGVDSPAACGKALTPRLRK